MKIEGKHICKFIILIAGIIIFSHAVIPHHHHFDSAEAHHENLGCETSNLDRNNENADSHCHAFNLIISESKNVVNVNSTLSVDFNLDLFDVKAELFVIPKLFGINYSHRLWFLPYKQKLVSKLSLRGPPAIV